MSDSEKRLRLATLAPFVVLILFTAIYIGPRLALPIHWAVESGCAWLTWRFVRGLWRSWIAAKSRAPIRAALMTGFVGGGLGLLCLLVIMSIEAEALNFVHIEPLGWSMEAVMNRAGPPIPNDFHFNLLNLLTLGTAGVLFAVGGAMTTAMDEVVVTVIWHLVILLTGLLAMLSSGLSAFFIAKKKLL